MADLPLGTRLLKAARADGVMLCGFDTFNMETAQAVVRAADEVGSPVFLQVAITSIAHAGLDAAASFALAAKRGASVPVCVHMDHGLESSDPAQLKAAARAGFESIMVEASELPLEDNIRMCRDAVEFAHPMGVSVEAELGEVPHDTGIAPEELARLMTDPNDAARLVEATGIDYLAVSIGSISGFYKSEVHLDLERLSAIAERVGIPLVLHGGTGIPTDQLREAARLGIAKINIAHGMRREFCNALGSFTAANPEEFDPRKPLDAARDAAQGFVVKKIREISG